MVAPTSFIDLPSEPVQYMIVQGDRDSSLTFWNPDHRAAFGLAEIVFTFHSVPHTPCALAPWQGVRSPHAWIGSRRFNLGSALIDFPALSWAIRRS